MAPHTIASSHFTTGKLSLGPFLHHSPSSTPASQPQFQKPAVAFTETPGPHAGIHPATRAPSLCPHRFPLLSPSSPQDLPPPGSRPDRSSPVSTVSASPGRKRVCPEPTPVPWGPAHSCLPCGKQRFGLVGPAFLHGDLRAREKGRGQLQGSGPAPTVGSTPWPCSEAANTA